MKTPKSIAIVGGGMAGLTAALRLSDQGYAIDLYEAAPALGGRTKSFYDKNLQVWVDNGPHMMVGAYTATKQLLADVHASQFVTWQDSLTLPLWDEKRGFFALHATAKLPIALALLLAVSKLPQHDFSSVKAMLRIALSMKNIQDSTLTVAQWLAQCQAPALLIQDMLEVLCLGVMNEPMDTANAQTFARVLNTSFSSHKNAKMGWFNQPLSIALIAPIQKQLEQAGVNIHLKQSIRDVRSLHHDAIILALPAFARHRLLGEDAQIACQAITNVHLWFKHALPMPSMMVGMLGTYSQWLFDVSAMLEEVQSTPDSQHHGLQHLCVTVSADTNNLSQQDCLEKVMQELAVMFDKKLTAPQFSRVIVEKRATVLVREQQRSPLATHIFDAGEMPTPGQLPATIELAVLQGEKAALSVQKYLK